MKKTSPVFRIFCIALSFGILALITLNGCSDEDSPTPPPADTTAPSISLSSSENLITTPSSLVLTASASDQKALASVTFLEGETVLHTDMESPYEFTFPVTQADNRVHAFKAIATDAAGNEGESEVVEVVIYIDPEIDFVNGGFDSGADGWELFHFDEWSGWTDETGNPAGCMRLNEFGNCEVDPGLTQQVSNLMPGLSFTVSGQYRPYVAWIGNPSAESFVVTVDSVVVASFARGPNGEDWSDFSAEFTATQVSHTIGFWAEYSCDDSSYEMDNVVIDVTR